MFTDKLKGGGYMRPITSIRRLDSRKEQTPDLYNMPVDVTADLEFYKNTGIHPFTYKALNLAMPKYAMLIYK